MVGARRPRIQCFPEGLMLILAGDLPDCVEPTVEIEKLPQEHHVVVLCCSRFDNSGMVVDNGHHLVRTVNSALSKARRANPIAQVVNCLLREPHVRWSIPTGLLDPRPCRLG